jgi:hypothetical protein
VSRYITTASSDTILIITIDTAFHITHHNDQTITSNLISQGLSTTATQVKRIRLANNWLRRGINDDQLAAVRATTFTLIESALY